jgi:glyoxylase-like metal-dependent hydrolase (beta-lactamase superfamily II)
VDFTYEEAGMREGPIEIVHLPGHCPGHVAIKLEDILFCGDILLTGITPHQSPEELAPFLGVSHFLDSLAVLERWGQGSRLILNGHDEVITDLPSCAGNVRANLSRRISQTLAAFSRPATIADATGVVYAQREGYNALLVLEKVGAYVEYLYQRGLLEIVNQEEVADGLCPVPIRYRSLFQASDVETLLKERTHVFV